MKYSSFNFDVSIKVRNDEEAFFGPGLCELLKHVHKNSSLWKSCKQMKLSSSKAYKMLKNSETALGYPLLIRQVGGNGGGYCLLTERGLWHLEQYTKLEQETRLFMKNYLEEHSAEEFVEKEDSKIPIGEH